MGFIASLLRLCCGRDKAVDQEILPPTPTTANARTALHVGYPARVEWEQSQTINRIREGPFASERRRELKAQKARCEQLWEDKAIKQKYGPCYYVRSGTSCESEDSQPMSLGFRPRRDYPKMSNSIAWRRASQVSIARPVFDEAEWTSQVTESEDDEEESNSPDVYVPPRAGWKKGASPWTIK